MIEAEKVEKSLLEIKKLKKEYRFYDCHVHPFDIFNPLNKYQQNPFNNGIYSLNASRFALPEIKAIDREATIDNSPLKSFKKELVRKFILLQSQKDYFHIGAPVLIEFMDKCSMDEALLLPVPYGHDDFEGQMKFMEDLYGRNSRFRLSGAVPQNILNHEMDPYLNRLTDRFEIEAVKVHPIISGLDLSSKKGIERFESILAACHTYKLAVVLHGGSSILYRDHPHGEYSEIENLEKIDWTLSRYPVVIAHAACYDCGLQRAEKVILPRLNKMLEKYNNLLVDTSALAYRLLELVLKKVDMNRIIFGSDALYFRQWSEVVKVYDILMNSNNNNPDNFLKIVCKNPAATLFKKIDKD